MSIKSARGGASQGKHLVLFRFVNERGTESQPDVVSFSHGIADEIRTRMLLVLVSGERLAAAVDGNCIVFFGSRCGSKQGGFCTEILCIFGEPQNF